MQSILAPKSAPSLVTSRFGETRWSLVGQVGHDDAGVRQEALEAILRRYFAPLRSHLVVRKRIEPHRADDLLQEFIADKVLRLGILRTATREKGKFRTFLLMALDRFVLNQVRNLNAAKRAPEKGFVDLADDPSVSDDEGEPSREFDTQWARTVLENALARMREVCRRGGRNDLWDAFQERVVGPALNGSDASSYAELAARYSFRSPAEAANVVLTGKRMLVRFLREVVGEYGRDEAEIDEEIRDLRRILAGAGGPAGATGATGVDYQAN